MSDTQYMKMLTTNNDDDDDYDDDWILDIGDKNKNSQHFGEKEETKRKGYLKKDNKKKKRKRGARKEKNKIRSTNNMIPRQKLKKIHRSD